MSEIITLERHEYDLSTDTLTDREIDLLAEKIRGTNHDLIRVMVDNDIIKQLMYLAKDNSNGSVQRSSSGHSADQS